MNYIICDDDAVFAEDLALKIKNLEPDCDIKIFNSGSALMFNMDDIGLDTDAVFMDIKLRDSNGINIAVRLLNKFPSIKIVYVTGYVSRFSQAIFECPEGFEPVAYLAKPIEEHYLKNALKKSKTAEKRYDNITIKYGGELIIINPKDLIGVTCNGRKLTVHTAENDYEIYGRLSAIFGVLPDCFVRVSKSHIVNITHITKISYWKKIVMSDGSEYPLTRTYIQEFKQLLIVKKSNLRRV